MKISDSIKRQISNAFVFTNFPSRDVDVISRILSTNVHGSGNVQLVAEFNGVEVEPIDEFRDRVKVIYDDLSVDCIFTWRENDRPKGYCLISVA